MRTRRPGVLVIGHLPPPVHGMAVATEAFARLIGAYADVILVRTSSDRGSRDAVHHALRVLRVCHTLVCLPFQHPRVRTIYLSCDAGAGLMYTGAIVAAGRLLGYHVWLHHHSFSYLRKRSRTLSLIARLGGGACTHVVGCEKMRKELQRLYETPDVTILPLDFLVRPGSAGDEARHDSATVPERRERAPGAPIVVGALSNWTLEKGLELVFDTVETLEAAGIHARAVIAGPIMNPASDSVIHRRMSALTGLVEYWGPTYGHDKERFFRTIDVFLFPSRYAHESFGIVAAEALAAGVPIIAYEAGCLQTQMVGRGGLVLRSGEPFADAATAAIARWIADPGWHEELGATARNHAVERWEAATRTAHALAVAIAEFRRSG